MPDVALVEFPPKNPLWEISGLSRGDVSDLLLVQDKHTATVLNDCVSCAQACESTPNDDAVRCHDTELEW